MPRIFLKTLGYFLYTQCVKSPPSSRIWRINEANICHFNVTNRPYESRKTFFSDHVGLPTLRVDAAVNAPPEVVFRFSFPGKHGDAWNITEKSIHLITWDCISLPTWEPSVLFVLIKRGTSADVCSFRNCWRFNEQPSRDNNMSLIRAAVTLRVVAPLLVTKVCSADLRIVT